MGPIQDPPLERRSPNWNPNAHCKYHQGRGHFTDNCWKVKGIIQNLINDGLITIPFANEDSNIENKSSSEILAITKYHDHPSPTKAMIKEDHKKFLDAMIESPLPSKEDIDKLQKSFEGLTTLV